MENNYSMKINQIIEKNDKEFRQLIREDNKVIAQSKLREDLLQDTYLHAMKMWKQQEIDEETGYNWLRQKIINSILYQYKKIDGKLIYVDSITAHIVEEDGES